MATKRRICFVTGTRAEFGLMRSVLRAIGGHRRLELQLVVTGMHLDRRLGHSIDQIRAEGWTIDGIVKWESRLGLAQATGRATAEMAGCFERLGSEVVLVVGDRVEAFAAATAGHLSQRVVAHVHGGDRAEGQVDDALRHAITKLAHVHFPATRESAERIERLGEQPWRIHRVGSPGLDGMESLAAGVKPAVQRPYALIVLHPADGDEKLEESRAGAILKATLSVGFERVVIVYPNNDPGSAGIVRCWTKWERDERVMVHRNVPRGEFLGLMRDAAVLVGNSSSGIIEAGSFGTPVIDVGPRQRGRERSKNVTTVPYGQGVRRALLEVWNGGCPRRARASNVYAGRDTGVKIADILARLTVDRRLLRKLISH